MKQFAIAGLFLTLVAGCSIEKLYQMKQNRKVYPYEQVTFHDVVKRYLNKDYSGMDGMEGIYSVSIVAEKKGKGFLSPVEKNKIMNRKENYSTVVILRDTKDPNREYIEIPLDKENLPSYSIRGEFTKMKDSNIMVYKHLERRGEYSTYTFTYDEAKDMLEGIRTENSGQTEYTYKLTYIKLHPKKEPVTTNQP
ncbi:MAG: hypothetical protein DYG99_12910 [Bacteroidetes bacterium CHB5]|nr:hypothetical protein [Bacteroidetes bacterium CHB5]